MSERIKSILLLSLALLFPIAVYLTLSPRISDVDKKVYTVSCQRDNELRRVLRDLVDSQLARQKASVASIVASPTASAAEKVTAQKNLASAENFSAQTRTAFAPITDCTRVPS